MKEEESEPNWFLRWEEELPSPEELMPLSQSLITPDLALALGIIPTPNSNSGHQQRSPPPPPNLTTHSPIQRPSSQNHQSHHQSGRDYDLSEIGGGSSGGGGGGSGGGGGGEEQARTLKRPRLVWTPQLHKRFVDAVSHLGIKHAVPKTIMQLMSVDGLTRENVASHLQKYRLYLKRMQGISSGSAGVHASVSHSDEKLFASGPIPHHFLTQRPTVLGPSGPEQFMPFVPITSSLQQQQQQQQMVAAAAHQQQQFYNHRHMGSIGSSPSFDRGGFFGRQQQQQQQLGIQRMGRPVGFELVPQLPTSNFIEDSDSGAGGGGRKVLTLFPDY